MKTLKERRAAFMSYLTQVMDQLDKSGDNSKNYQEIFGEMSDTAFDKWATDFFANEKKNFYLEIVEYERDLKIEDVERCAKFMKVPLFEYVALPYLTTPGSPMVVTPEPVAVGWTHEKRMQQTLLKKSGGSITAKKKNPKTGQVIGSDKNARNTDVETYAMLAQNAKVGLSEFMGPRADDESAKAQMYNAISAKGYVSVDDLSDDRYNKTSLNTFNVYFLMQGITTNMVSPLNIIPGVRTKEEARKIRDDFERRRVENS